MNVETILSVAVAGLMALLLIGGAYVLNLAISRKSASQTELTDMALDEWVRSGRFFLYATVGGTLTSLASVYVFFLFQYPFFGFTMLACLIAFPLGGWVGQRFALYARTQLGQTERGREALKTGLMAAAVRSHASENTAQLVRVLSFINICAVIWLEIKILSMIICELVFGLPYNSDHALEFALVAGIVAALLIQFVLRFGMQGVVATDALYWPFVILSALVIVAIVSVVAFNQTGSISILVSEVSLTPLIGTPTLVLFLINIFVVNAVYHVGRDDLWLRLSAFEENGRASGNIAANQLFKATLWALPVWGLLIVVGMLVPVVLGKPAETIINVFELVRVSPVVLPIVLLGVLAAMMSTADNQFFAIKRLLLYRPGTGAMVPGHFGRATVLAAALTGGGVIFGLTWGAIRHDVNDQDLVFACLGLPAVLFPVLFRIIYYKNASLWHVLLPAVAYFGFIVAGLIEAGHPSPYTIVAAPISLLVGGAYALVGAKLPWRTSLREEEIR